MSLHSQKVSSKYSDFYKWFAMCLSFYMSYNASMVLKNIVSVKVYVYEHKFEQHMINNIKYDIDYRRNTVFPETRYNGAPIWRFSGDFKTGILRACWPGEAPNQQCHPIYRWCLHSNQCFLEHFESCFGKVLLGLVQKSLSHLPPWTEQAPSFNIRKETVCPETSWNMYLEDSLKGC